ncbi:unnamed protein product [Cyprideis torosa]|uniref:Uncharacterized protein n=1 Tax=Cyprideis torosa TaxID=163714 RepID=A0A7R8W1V8_9CRUS|nr:unnamed protein product [Cyprideis torosa]CAG0881228.1 unnamed protein product [Cyprideis torosa]
MSGSESLTLCALCQDENVDLAQNAMEVMPDFDFICWSEFFNGSPPSVDDEKPPPLCSTCRNLLLQYERVKREMLRQLAELEKEIRSRQQQRFANLGDGIRPSVLEILRVEPYVKIEEGQVNLDGHVLNDACDAFYAGTKHENGDGGEWAGRRRRLSRSVSSGRNSPEDAVESDSEKLNLVCATCGDECSSVSDLTKHESKFHPTGFKVCPVCGEQFILRREVKSHLSEHRDKGEWLECAVHGCVEGFRTKQQLSRHRLKFHGSARRGPSWVCRYKCGALFWSNEEKMQHYSEAHRDERPYVCECCGLHWSSKASCEKHEANEKREKDARLEKESSKSEEVKCPVCDKKCESKSTLNRHLESHNKTCPVCGKNLCSTTSLIWHMASHDPTKKVQCKICGILCSTKYVLKNHMLKHEEGTPKYQCDHCGQCFRQRCTFISHVKRHRPKAVNCSQCDKTFSSASTLRLHVQGVHQEARRYSCEICGLTFKYPAQIGRHRTSFHGTELRYKCHICGKGFKSWSNRYAHVLIHSDLKPFECTVCGSGFPRKPKAIEHIREAHPEISDEDMENAIKKNKPDMPKLTDELGMPLPTS